MTSSSSCPGPRAPTRDAASCSTRPANSRASSAASCFGMPLHREPEGTPSSSTACTMPSSVRAVTARPVTEVVDALVVIALARSSVRRRPGARAGSAFDRRPRSARTRPRRCAEPVVADDVGQVLQQGAAAATLSTCSPRQMPRNGSSRSIAAASSASSHASRSGCGGSVLGCGCSAVAGGLDVAAPGDDQAVEPVEHARPRPRRRPVAAAAARRCRPTRVHGVEVHLGQERRRDVPHSGLRALRGRWSGR